MRELALTRCGSDICGIGARAVPCGIALCALLIACWIAPSVGAQDIQRFHPSVSDEGFLGFDGTRPPPSLRGSIHLFGDLAIHPVELQTARGQVTPVETRWMLHLGGELGLGGRGSIALRVPLIAFQHGPFKTRTAQVFMLADPQIWARYRVWGASMSDRNVPHDGPGLTVQAGVMLPMGKRERVTADGVMLPVPVAGRAFASDGRTHAELGLLGDFQLFGAGLGGSLGFRHHFWNPNSVPASATKASNELTFAAALKLPIPPLPGLAAALELRGVTGFQAARDTALELNLGLRQRLGAFLIVLGGGFGLTRGVGAPDGRVFVGLYFVPPQTDNDGDGVDDSDDGCPFLAEDMDNFQDQDGCPDPDNDNDLVPDLDDKCPSDAAEEGKDEDEDGCTDAAP